MKKAVISFFSRILCKHFQILAVLLILGEWDVFVVDTIGNFENTEIV